MVRNLIQFQPFAWLNMVLQITSALVIAFTPIITLAGSDKRFLQNTEQSALQIHVYTLGANETVDTVAKKYNMTLWALRKLNQLPTFAHGFDNLKQGDDLDVPLSPLPEVQQDGAASSGDAYTDKDGDAREQKLAGFAKQAGGFLARKPNGNAVSSMARGMVTGAAGSEIQQWLSQFGTARVQLDTDKNFSLKNSQLDLLIPLYEQKGSLVFTQGSLHRTDDRTQSNLGVGYRWFVGDWMLGGNTFLDYDLSRDHARMGVGVEYWRDFLKLAANSYHRLTKWKNSPDVTDYKERPANGWDIRAQAWLSALPQLGGKLTYEQYYGSEVALFGKDNRQRNPYAITVGVSYTPVPLLTFSAEQRQGKSGENDTRLGVELNYQLGMPLQPQINPDAVVTMRSLAGSRYDLVERNNNIVLDYRKKEVIRLHTADRVIGHAGEQKSLGVSVNSKYGLERIDWSSPVLLSAGGKIMQSGTDWVVLLPKWQLGTAGVNNYTISAVAVDKKGNVSERANTQVTVHEDAIDVNTSSFTPSDITLPADGRAKQKLTLKVNDRDGNPVDIDADEISLNTKKIAKLRGDSNATVSAFTRKGAGEYVATLTAGTMPESFTLTPSARKMQFASARVSLTADHKTALISTLDVLNDNASADGKSENKIKLVVVDAENNRVPAQAVNLKASNGAVVKETVITDNQGEVVVPVTSDNAGEATITASINGGGNKEAELTFYGKPVIMLEDIVYRSKGSDGLSGKWTPVFTDDTMSIRWRIDNSNAFSKTESVTVYLKDTDGKVISEQDGSLKEINTTKINPEASFWDKKLHVEIVARGHGTLSSTTRSEDIVVDNLEPKNIWDAFTVRSYVETVIPDGTRDVSCEETHLGKEHTNLAVINGNEISFGGKQLLSPMNITAYTTYTYDGNRGRVPFSSKLDNVDHTRKIDFGKAIIAHNCWHNSVGGYDVSIEVSYAGNIYSYPPPNRAHGWGGNGTGLNGDDRKGEDGYNYDKFTE